MELLAQRVIDGLANGSIYSLIALAIVLVFMSTGTLNLAQGAMGMFATFVAWWLIDEHGWNLWPAFIVALTVGLALGAVIERVVVRPVEKERDHTPAIIVTLGILLVLQALAGYLFTTDTVQIPSVLPTGSSELLGVRLRHYDLGLVVVAGVVGIGLYLLFRHTQLGLAMRAAVDNPESSRLVGVNHGLMLMVGWALAGGLGALAGVLIAPTTLVSPAMLDNPLFLGFASAALGGFASPFGALVGGMVMGLVESLAPAYIPGIDGQMAGTSVFVVMIAVLIVTPHGLFGRATAVRA